MPECRIGCSGFLYDSWRGTFYPEHLQQKRWLSFYLEKFNTVELNVTFYRLLKKETFERWREETPPYFRFSLKGSRFITHIKKLKDVELPLSTFFNTTAPLMEKLGVILWQLPPNFKVNLRNLEDFIEGLKIYPVRHVFEFRHKSWMNRKVFKLLSASNIAICTADWPVFAQEVPQTADFVYIRRHGEEGSYATRYTSDQLKMDAKMIKTFLKEGRDVYIYFNNDASGYAPANAMELKSILERSLPARLRKEAEPRRKKPAKPASGRKTAKKPGKKKARHAPVKRKKTARKPLKKTVRKPAKKTAAKKHRGKLKKKKKR